MLLPSAGAFNITARASEIVPFDSGLGKSELITTDSIMGAFKEFDSFEELIKIVSLMEKSEKFDSFEELIKIVSLMDELKSEELIRGSFVNGSSKIICSIAEEFKLLP